MVKKQETDVKMGNNVHLKMKKLLIAMFALLLVTTPLALGDLSVYVDDVANGPFSVVAGQKLLVEAYFSSTSNHKNVRVEVELSYDGKEVEVSSESRDVIAGTLYREAFSFQVPSDIDTTPSGDEYTLSVRLKDGKGRTLESQDFDLTVQRKSHLLEVQKVLGPSTAEAGKPLIWTVVVKNTGSHEQEDVYVKVYSPELGLSVEDRAGDIEAEDDEGDEDTAVVDVPLRIPGDAVEGTYTLYVKAYNDDTETVETKTLWVSGTKKAVDSTEVVPVSRNLAVKQGETGLYQLNVLNLGNSAQTYTVTVEGLEGWASYQANPLSVKLNPQASQVLNLGLTVSENALVGEHSFTVKLLSDGKELRSLSLSTDVQKASAEKNAMLISVVVLAIVLVVLLVLLVKMRKSDDEDSEESEESYY